MAARLAALRARAQALAPKERRALPGLLDFVRATRPDYEVGRFHRDLASRLDAFARGEVRRLMVFAPPQHGKSQLVSRHLPAYALGLDPDLRVIACSYADSLASRMNRDVQRIVDSEPYRAVFHRTRLYGKQVRTQADGAYLRNSDIFEIVNAKGSYRSAGVGAGITGMPFDLGIIDDPIKGAVEAYSPTTRERIWEWYQMEFLTRQSPRAGILLTMTRWHEDDLAGRLLKLAREDAAADQWEVVRFPATPEAPCWPERFGADFLRRQKAGMSPQQWAAMYEQSPQPLEGAYFGADWFRRWRDTSNAWHLSCGRVVLKDQCRLLAICDPAASEKQTADHTALMACALTPTNDLLVLEVVRARFALEAICPALLALCRRWSLQEVAMEANGFQVALAREARRTQGMPPVREVTPASRSKLVRATEAVTRAAAGQVYLAESAPWVPGFIDECVRFTGRDGDPDDQVDCLAYAARLQSSRIDSRGGGAKPYVMGR